MTPYTKAVDYLEQVMGAFKDACDVNQLSLPNIETGTEYAFKILKTHQDYEA